MPVKAVQTMWLQKWLRGSRYRATPRWKSGVFWLHNFSQPRLVDIPRGEVDIASKITLGSRQICKAAVSADPSTKTRDLETSCHELLKLGI